jgi:hypothetical protein
MLWKCLVYDMTSSAITKNHFRGYFNLPSSCMVGAGWTQESPILFHNFAFSTSSFLNSLLHVSVQEYIVTQSQDIFSFVRWITPLIHDHFIYLRRGVGTQGCSHHSHVLSDLRLLVTTIGDMGANIERSPVTYKHLLDFILFIVGNYTL